MRRLVLLIALGLVAAACGGGTTKSASPSPSPSPSKTTPPNTIDLVGRVFSPSFLTVARGTTVSWVDTGTGKCANSAGVQEPCPHNVVSVDNLFNSHPGCTGPGTTCMTPGEPFRYTFANPGTYVYYCHVHAVCTGKTCGGMAGRIVVT